MGSHFYFVRSTYYTTITVESLSSFLLCLLCERTWITWRHFYFRVIGAGSWSLLKRYGTGKQDQCGDWQAAIKVKLVHSQLTFRGLATRILLGVFVYFSRITTRRHCVVPFQKWHVNACGSDARMAGYQPGLPYWSTSTPYLTCTSTSPVQLGATTSSSLGFRSTF
jgi:hypothetical protein